MNFARMIIAAATASLLLGGVGAPRAAAAAPSGLHEAARAWLTVINDQDENAAPTVYLAAPTHEAWLIDRDRFRGIPVEIGLAVVDPAGDRAALHLHSGAGKYFLASWRRATEGWRLSDVVDLVAGLFVGAREQPAPVVWPSTSSMSAAPAGVVYRLAQGIRQSRPRLSQKDMESQFFQASRPEDRASYPDLIDEVTRSSTVPEVTDVKVVQSGGARIAEATVRLKSAFRLRLAASEAGWRIVSASARPLPPVGELPPAARASLRAVAERVLAALRAKDSPALGALSLDLAAPVPRQLPADRAATVLASVREQFGGRFSLLRVPTAWANDRDQVMVDCEAPDASGDWKRLVLEFALVGTEWRLLDMHDGTVTLKPEEGDAGGESE